jgi:FKBP-type peptidyl-prolyl cis-trans isomerase FklB
MRKTIWFVIVAAGALTGAGARALTTRESGAAKPALDTQKDKVSYAMGVTMARTFKRPGVEVDVDVVERGLRDELVDGKIVISEADLQKTMLALRVELRQKQAQVMKTAADSGRKEADTFFAENAKREGVVTLPSGLQYKILRAGTGKTPTDADSVDCQYRGTRLDGAEFDSSYARGQPATFRVAGVIRGWQQALKLMPTGSKWQLFVPPELAYGERGSGAKIPPNAALVFEVELLAIKKPG